MAEAVLLEAVNVNVVGLHLRPGLNSGPERFFLNVVGFNLLDHSFSFRLRCIIVTDLKFGESSLLHSRLRFNNLPLFNRNVIGVELSFNLTQSITLG